MSRLTISNVAYAIGFDTEGRKINGSFAGGAPFTNHESTGAFTGTFSDDRIAVSFVDGYAEDAEIRDHVVTPRSISAFTADAAEDAAENYRDAMRSARAVLFAYARPVVERKDVPDETVPADETL